MAAGDRDELTPLQETPPAESESRSHGDPDWAGIGRDTAFFFGYQIVRVAVLYALPGDINRWQDKDVSFDNWWNNVTQPPVWDSDPWGTNYITHPYWGATYYIRARERGFGNFTQQRSVMAPRRPVPLSSHARSTSLVFSLVLSVLVVSSTGAEEVVNPAAPDADRPPGPEAA